MQRYNITYSHQRTAIQQKEAQTVKSKLFSISAVLVILVITAFGHLGARTVAEASDGGEIEAAAGESIVIHSACGLRVPVPPGSDVLDMGDHLSILLPPGVSITGTDNGGLPVFSQEAPRGPNEL